MNFVDMSLKQIIEALQEQGYTLEDITKQWKDVLVKRLMEE
jgi:DNA-binding transcriptional MerR regulator